MKLNGRKIEGPNVETVIIPRGEDEPIVFRCQAVLDYDEFDLVCPRPIPPVRIMRGGRRVTDVEDKTYLIMLESYAKQRTNWMILQSLKATENLEWETIQMSDPNTWINFDKELKDSGLSEIERIRIVNAVMTANCLNESKLDEARESFLASRQVREEK
jgi:hypothetical protein